MDERPHDAPEWLWYGEADGKPVVTFGRWPKARARWRYKWAEIQPTEHDHPKRCPAMKIIPAFEMPSEDELHKSSLAWFERVGPTLIDRWPPELAALSMPTEFVKFPMELMEPLFETKDWPDPRVAEFAMELDAKIGWKRRFVRLNSRSPKDATWPFEAPATISGKEAMSMFGGSERILDDLCRFRHIPEHPAYVCLREWHWGFRVANEYRCFVKDGKLIAVTHYDYTKPWRGPTDGGKAIRAAIDGWFAEHVRPALPIDTVVFDLHIDDAGKFLLIEINPYGLSDPCHFGTYDRVENASNFIEFAPGIPAHVGSSSVDK